MNFRIMREGLPLGEYKDVGKFLIGVICKMGFEIPAFFQI